MQRRSPAIGARVLWPERRIPKKPGSEVGKIVANSGKIGRLCKASGYLAFH
jgi:hypothetical protein